jgi:glycosyltransferase involved in cell wall biosynthesis
MTWTLAIPVFGTDRGRSGLSTYTRGLLRDLPTLDPTLRLEVVGHPDDLEPLVLAESSPQVTFHKAPGWTQSRVGDWLWLRVSLEAWALEAGADAVFFPAGNRRVQPLRSLATVATVHDLGELRIPDKYSRLRRWRVQHEIVPALRRVTLAFAISEATRTDLSAATGLSSASFPVVLNGIDPRFTPGCAAKARTKIREEYGIQRPYLLYVARLEHPAKNHVGLLEAFARAGLEATHDLVLVGPDWPGSEAVTARVQALGLTDVVRRPGFVPDEDLVALYRGAVAQPFVSRFEGFGLPLIEGMAAGCPQLVSNRDPMRSLAGEGAILIDPDDPNDIALQLRRVTQDPALRDVLRLAGLERASHFSSRACAEGTLALVRQAIRMKATANPTRNAAQRQALGAA